MNSFGSKPWEWCGQNGFILYPLEVSWTLSSEQQLSNHSPIVWRVASSFSSSQKQKHKRKKSSKVEQLNCFFICLLHGSLPGCLANSQFRHTSTFSSNAAFLSEDQNIKFPSNVAHLTDTFMGFISLYEMSGEDKMIQILVPHHSDNSVL